MFAHDPEATASVVRAVVDVGLGLPVFAKLSPNVTDLTVIARAAVDAGADRAHARQHRSWVCSSTPRPAGRSSVAAAAACPVPRSSRSRCGRCTTSRARSRSVPVIGTGGVQSGVDAVEMLLAGATAVGVGTASFLDPRAPYRVLDELVEWCASHDVARVQ